MTLVAQLSLFTKDQIHHSPRNQKEAVLYYLSKMDFEMVSLVLDEERTYSEATKDVFIEKLKEVFSYFSSEGDTELRLIPGRCDPCRCHRDHAGYSFVGNQSNYRLDLIVEKNADEIIDIFYCSDFALFIEENLESKESLSFYFDFDEKADFNPPAQFWIDVQLGDKACEELVQSAGEFIDFNSLEEWLNRYEPIYERIEEFEVAALQARFHYCYSHVKNLQAFDEIKHESMHAISGFHSKGLCKKKWKLLLKWLVEYEDLYHKVNHLDIELSCYLYPNLENVKQHLVGGIKKLYYDPSQFEIQNSFLILYNRYGGIIYRYYESLPSKYPIVKEEKDANSRVPKTLKCLLAEKGIDY
jgi:hypothetical protein